MRNAPTTLIGMEMPELQAALGAGQPAYRAKQLFGALYHQKIDELSKASALPKAVREQLEASFPLGLPLVDNFFDSSDGTRRYLLKLHDSRTIETVLMPEEGRN